MSHLDRRKAVRSLFEAYRTKDRRIVEELLAEDFTFTSP
nr:nuclear transport factor 2 family protein [Mesorhizobium xinjiangense]